MKSLVIWSFYKRKFHTVYLFPKVVNISLNLITFRYVASDVFRTLKDFPSASYIATAMSEEALKVLNSMPGLEGNNQSSCKEDLSKQGTGIKTANGNIEELKSKSSASIRPLVNGESSNPVAEVGSSEVEYIESENLTDLEDVSSSLKVLTLLDLFS